MLHLLNTRLLAAFVALAALLTLLADALGMVGSGPFWVDALWVLARTSVVVLVLTFALTAVWRWVPGAQSIVFPYLGGHWKGNLEYDGSQGHGTKAVTLVINHSLLRIMLTLDSDESTSRTLSAHADHDEGIDRDRLYYVFLNERKEGVPGAGDRYRGLAIMRVEAPDGTKLRGDYFTERKGTGTLSLERQVSHPWWALWK